jgi:hypothetical protein
MPQPHLDAEAIGRRVVVDVVPDEVQYFDVAATQFRYAPRAAHPSPASTTNWGSAWRSPRRSHR